jgi:hypothetical protein
MVRAIRAALVAAAGLALAAAAPPPVSPPDPPPLPEPIAARTTDGRFEPGNFEYLRGYFPEATEAEKAEYASILAWLERCEAEGKSRLDAELAALGVSLEGGSMMGAANICQQVVQGEHFEDFASYAEVAEAARGARLVFDTLVQSIDRARQRTQPRDADLAADLHHRTLGEQLLRLAYSWGWSEVNEPRAPKLTEKERTVFVALLNSEVLWVDHRNTEWLKEIIAGKGWPKVSEVGERGANGAWLLTQHADLDPAFQLRALRLMEPLVANGEVSKRSFAYLYDRVTLKLTGKQRYATQFWCKDGTMQPQPLEQADNIDELRAAMELEPLAEYAKNFRPTC